MKKIALPLAIICLIISAAGHAAAQTDKRVAHIRAKTLEINKRKGLTKTTADVPGISTEGAEAVIYRSGTDIVKINATIYGETYKAASEFYFEGGKLIFSYDRVTRYRMPLPAKGPIKVLRVDQIRGYFDDGNMFRLLNSEKSVAESDPEFEAESGRILGTIDAILDAESDPRVAGNNLLDLLGCSY